MAIGPVEYIILGFPGNQSNGEIAPELAKLVDSGTIRVLDLVFITKDADGNVGAVSLLHDLQERRVAGKVVLVP